MSDPWALPQASPAFGGGAAGVGRAAVPAPLTQPESAGEERFPTGAEAGWRPDPTTPGLLRLWDGRHWTEHTRPLDPVAEAVAQAPPVRTNQGVRAWALIAQLMISLTVLASCVSLLYWIATLNTLQIWSLQPGDLHDEQARSLLRTSILVLGALLLVGFFSWLSVLVWVAVARNDRHMNKALLRGSMAGTVIGCFLPLVNIRVAWRTLSDLCQASDPRRAAHGATTASRAAPPIVIAFCALYFCPGWIQALALIRIQQALGTVDHLRDLIFAFIISTALGVGAAVCLILIITRVTDNLRGRTSAAGTGTATPLAAQFTRA